MRCRLKTKPPRFQAKPPADNPGASPIPFGTTGHAGLSAGDYSNPRLQEIMLPLWLTPVASPKAILLSHDCNAGAPSRNG
jgi:hypothetical protein